MVVAHKLGHGEVVFVLMTLPSFLHDAPLSSIDSTAGAAPDAEGLRERIRSVRFCDTRRLAHGVHCIFVAFTCPSSEMFLTGLVIICEWIAPT